MSITAILGAGIGYVTYELIYYFNPVQPRASSSWFLAFVIGVARQHALHRWLTFLHKTPYWGSLRRAYVMYSGSLLVTSLFNWVLTEHFQLSHRLAWFICLLLTGLISLVFLKSFVFRDSN